MAGPSMSAFSAGSLALHNVAFVHNSAYTGGAIRQAGVCAPCAPLHLLHACTA